jgi:hypothetical protein
MTGVGRAAALVVDDAHLLPLGAEAEHRPHEVVPCPAEEPRAADDPAFENLLLPQVLRVGVRRERVGMVSLDVRRPLLTVEDVVARVVENGNPKCCDVHGPDDVDGRRRLSVGFRAVHVRPRSRMKNDVRAVLEQDRLRDVELAVCARIGAGKSLGERSAELAPRARNQDASVALASLVERVGESVLHR